MLTQEYKHWLHELKSKIRSTQAKAALAVNSALIHFYWDLGKMISEKEKVWGSKLINQISQDLKAEFPEIQGLSSSNLKYCIRFYSFYQYSIGQQPVAQLPNTTYLVENQDFLIGQQAVDQLENKPFISQQAVDQFWQQPVAKIPWGHNILIFSKSKDVDEALFYVSQTIENGWSRDTLGLQLKSNLYLRTGKTISNFKHTLPEPLSDLAQQTFKDPYIFDFMTMAKPYHEKDIEQQLTQHITKFLLELGKGFSFVGKQYHLEIAENDYYIDLLFYHIKLKCYVVIELKNTKFMPEYAGKLNFYLSAVDTLVKEVDDKPTIGIILCRDKNNIEAEFALRDMNKPMGVSEFNFTEILPEELKSSLPTIEELENELRIHEQF
jgi:predicted nuclease of restriction endonuclease-like (RecB) superfamily